MPIPVIPIAITLGTVGALYYTRDPVRELTQNKSYRIGINFNPAVFQAANPGMNVDQTQLLNTQIPTVIQNALAGMGFTNVRKVSGPTTSGGVTTYWYDGAWSRETKYIAGVLPAYFNIAVYAKLF